MSDDQNPDEGFKTISGVLAGLFPPEMLPQPEPKTCAKGKAKKRPEPSAKLVKASVEIHERPDDAEAAYLARELVQCTLPHRDPKTDLWVRRNGNFALGLQSPKDIETGEIIGLPYGPLPRLLLLWVVTEAIRTKSRNIKLADTLNDFLREIGLDPNTGRGKRGDATRLKEQMMRLFHCRISFQYNQGTKLKGRHAFVNMEVAQEGRFWWDFKSPDQGGLFESEIVLGEVFFKAITAAPVPLDMRALLPLKKSPLAIDLYTWATYRLFTMQRAGQAEIKIPLSELQEQFGSEYNRLNNFKAAFLEAIVKVQQVFPALDYTFSGNTLILRDRKHRPAMAPSDKTAAQRRLAERSPIDLVSDKARAKFKQEYPRMDVDAAMSDFYAWREDKGQASANTDKHFLGFAKTWARQNS